MTIGLVLTLTIAVIVAIVGICALAVYVDRNFSSEKFDERQKIERGNAYRFSHWVGMAYYLGLLAYFVFHTGKSQWALEPYLLITIGMLIQLQSFHIYCLMTHCALPLGEKPMPAIIGNLFLGCLYLAQYFLQYIPKDVVGLAGAQSMNLFRLLLAFDFFALAILHLIALFRKERE